MEKTQTKPSISLSLTVATGKPISSDGVFAHSTVASLLPFIDELIVVAVGTEGSSDLLRREMDDAIREWNGNFELIEISPSIHSGLFFRDEPGAYLEGSPLDEESFQPVATGKLLVADWSRIRNLGLGQCSREWRLVMSEGESLLRPQELEEVCLLMDRNRADLAFGCCLGREIPSIAPRICLNSPEIEWRGAAAESLEGSIRPAFVERGLETSVPPIREAEKVLAFKSLYAESRRKGWDITPRDFVQLARLAPEDMDGFAEKAIERCLETSLDPEERALACSVMGRRLETANSFEQASSWYERSLEEHGGWKSAMRLCRSRFGQGKWKAAHDAYCKGLERRNEIHLLDDGPETFTSTLILATEALHQMGMMAEAREGCQMLRVLYPGNDRVNQFCESIE